MVQLAALWRDGVLFSRWLPDVAYGYGLPLFNYYAPLVYYLTVPLALLGVASPVALNVSLGAALFVGALGMFLLTRELMASLAAGDDLTPALSSARGGEDVAPALSFARRGGGKEVGALVAALAYLYAPYLLFNVLQRANLGEAWALAFAPLALWRFAVLARAPGALSWALAALGAAAVLLSHNVTGLLFLPLLVGFVGASKLAQSQPRSWRAWLGPLAGIAAALALAAFFWLPALAEREYAQLARVIVTPDFDYRFNFVPPPELVALVPRGDTGRLNPAYPATLGIVQVLLALGGVGALVTRRARRRALPFWLLLGGALALTGLMLAISQPVWDNLSLLAYVQLPMRLRGLAALCLAPLTGVCLLWFAPRWQVLAAALAIVLLVASALPMLYPRYARDVPSAPALADMFAYEETSGALSTTSFGEYLPVWARDVPTQSPFAQDYARGAAPNRFVIPQGVTECGAQITRLRQAVCVSADVTWRALYRAFYFPGWSVRVDGGVVAPRANAGDGILTFDVPAGQHTLVVEYGGTPVENAANGISVAAAVLVAGAVLMGLFRMRRSDAPGSRGVPRHISTIGLLVVVALALILFKVLYVDRTDNPFVARYDGTKVEGIESPNEVTFDDKIQLLGFDAGGREVTRGAVIRPTLYWRALPGLGRNVSTFVHLTAPDGFVLAQKDNLHPANLPTTRWDLDAYAADVHPIEIPASLAPGVYQLRAGVYDPARGTRLRTSDGADFVLLGTVQVEK